VRPIEAELEPMGGAPSSTNDVLAIPFQFSL